MCESWASDPNKHDGTTNSLILNLRLRPNGQDRFSNSMGGLTLILFQTSERFHRKKNTLTVAYARKKGCALAKHTNSLSHSYDDIDDILSKSLLSKYLARTLVLRICQLVDKLANTES